MSRARECSTCSTAARVAAPLRPATARLAHLRTSTCIPLFRALTAPCRPDAFLLPNASRPPARDSRAPGVLPFTWRASTSKAFQYFSDGGKPTVAPIIQIILSRAPAASKTWVETVSSWDFERVVPAHFDVLPSLGPKEFASTFDFLAKGKNDVRFCDEVCVLRIQQPASRRRASTLPIIMKAYIESHIRISS